MYHRVWIFCLNLYSNTAQTRRDYFHDLWALLIPFINTPCVDDVNWFIASSFMFFVINDDHEKWIIMIMVISGHDKKLSSFCWKLQTEPNVIVYTHWKPISFMFVEYRARVEIFTLYILITMSIMIQCKFTNSLSFYSQITLFNHTQSYNLWTHVAWV